MTIAIGIVTRAQPISSLRVYAIVFFAVFAISACGGGAETTDNPTSQTPGNNNDTAYAGPAAESPEVLKFQQEFWSNAKSTNRCGNCHNESVGQVPMFVRNDDINAAYSEALGVVDQAQPSLSRIVEKVSAQPIGHNCWVADPGVCGTILTTWIENWVGETSDGAREIVLLAPASQNPADSKNFPITSDAFDMLVYEPILERYCQDCHSSESVTAQQPYFADPDLAVAYEAAKSKINLDTPGGSRFVIKVSPDILIGGQSHNCWNSDCPTAETQMLAAMTAFAGGILPTVVDPDLLTSKAIRLTDGILASGGNRYEDSQIALWEFQTGSGLVAFDSSGVDPAIDLNFSGDVTWFGGWGISIGANAAQGPGKAQGSTTASAKLHDVLKESGELSIEA